MPAERKYVACKRRIAAIVGIVALCAGCGSTIKGNPQPGATPADLDQIRTGPFKTEPVAYKPEVNTMGREWLSLMEGRRLLNYVLHPMDIDPDINVTGKTNIFSTALDIRALDNGMTDKHKDVFKDNVHFVAGVTVTKSNGSVRSPKDFKVGVLRFDSNAAAESAAQGLHTATLESGPRSEHELPSHPTAHASVAGERSIDAWKSHGIYVIMISAHIPTADTKQLVTLGQKSLEMQTSALDRQQPRPMDDVLDQPVDPENLMRRAMIREVGSSLEYSQYFGLLQPSGMLHYERDPAEARQKFDETGVDMVARRATTVYRTRDLAAAFQLQTFLAKPRKNEAAVNPPPGIADAQCLRLDEPDPNRNYDLLCAVVYDRYVAVVTERSTSLTARVDHALQERTAAQYAILKKCG